MNLLFWAGLFIIAVAAGLQWWHHQRSKDRPQDDLSERTLTLADHRDWPLKPGTWSVSDVAFLTATDRIRAAVRIQIDDSAGRRRQKAMELLAREIYRHTEVQAVFVEATGNAEGPDLYLFAADGRGWWGQEMISTAAAGPGLISRRHR